VIVHVDTSFLVDLLRETRRRDPGAARMFLDEHADDEIRMSVFVACELWAGVEGSNRPTEEKHAVGRLMSRIPVVVPGDGFPALYGRVLAPLQRSGRPIATMDLLIACTALESSAPLVTGNIDHFARVSGLSLLGYRQQDG
jgi:predicted nucleic acid-binding protein